MSKIIIVGGVAAGASVAARLRRLDEFAEIIIIEKSNYISYANCGLPYYIGDVIKEERDLIVQTPQLFKKRFNIDVRISSEVINVDTYNKKVKILNNNKEYDEAYDYLVLTPGSKARELFDNENDLLHLKNIEDVQRVKEAVQSASSVAVIGGGFIGIELAENLNHINKNVFIFEYGSHIMPNLDDDIVSYVEDKIRKNDIKLITNARINSITKLNNKFVIGMNDGLVHHFDSVVVSAGVVANTGFLKNSGIELDNRGFIIVNEYMQTNISNVYAAGDAVLSKHFITGQNENVALAGPANKQGRIIADNICGIKHAYDGSIGTNIIKVFDLVAGSSGLNSARLKKEQRNYDSIIIHPYNHATYYPNATQIHAKLFYDLDNLKILGIQAVGMDGVDKLIDVIATAIKLNGKVTDLVNLELAYAPPFLSAKSPANFFGFIAENIIESLDEFTTLDSISTDEVILDVRTISEYLEYHLDGAVNIPLDNLRYNMHKLNKDKTINIICSVGLRAHVACCILKAYGFKVKNIKGGYLSIS